MSAVAADGVMAKAVTATARSTLFIQNPLEVRSLRDCESLDINSSIAVRNPRLQSAGDVDDVSEAGHNQQLRDHGPVRVGLAVHEDCAVLVWKELRQLALDRFERLTQRPGDMPLRSPLLCPGPPPPTSPPLSFPPTSLRHLR